MPFDGMNCTRLGVTLTAGQQAAFKEIIAAMKSRQNHLLTGDAGTGKTVLELAVAVALMEMGWKVAFTAPTHKAVEVGRKKLHAAGITDIPCMTTHAMLSLSPETDADRLKFKRQKNAQPVPYRAVLNDEASMNDASLMGFMRRHLPVTTVLYTGDLAQLPPVNEKKSEAFQTKSRSHLDAPIRQAVDNPLLTVLDSLRCQQGKPFDWSWLRRSNEGSRGLFIPRRDLVNDWMRKAFTSDAFKENPDTHRYLCWTNQRVWEVNSRVRAWIYGEDIPTPFMPGERAMMRGPVWRMSDEGEGGEIVLNTNQEVETVSIERDNKTVAFPDLADLPAWKVVVPSWHMLVKSDDGLEVEIDVVEDHDIHRAALERLKAEAAVYRERWKDYHRMLKTFARVQSIYAMTVHNSQGSTMRNVFVDVHDIGRRVKSDVLEAQRLFYTAFSRPTDTAIAVT